MPRLDLNLLSRTRATTALPTASISAAALAAPGTAVRRVGGELGRLAETGERLLEEKREADADTAVAGFDYTLRLNELQNEAEPGAEGFRDTVKSDYVSFVDDHVAGIESDSARKRAKKKLMAREGLVLGAAARFEIGATLEVARQNADQALGVVENRVRQDPDAFNFAVADATALIMAQPGIDQTTKRGMAKVAAEGLVDARFEGLIAGAVTDAEFDRIENELRSDVWRDRFNPPDYDRQLDALAAARVSNNTKQASHARAAVATLETRSTAGVVVPAEELASAEALAVASGDAALVWRVAELHERQDAFIRARTLTLPAIRAAEAESRGDSAFSGTGLKPVVAAAISSAAQVSGVPASTLAMISQFEAGGGTPGATTAVDADGKPITSAFGPFQITEKTFRRLVAQFPEQFPEAQGVSDEVLLALRGDVDVSARATAFLAVSNAQILRRSLNRQPIPADLVLAHFLGAPQAVRFLKAMDRNPSADATIMFPDAAANNKSVFFQKDGTPRNLRQVRAEITDRSTTAPGRLEFARSEAFRIAGDIMERQLNEDPALLADSSGFAALQPLDSLEAFVERGQTMRAFFLKHNREPDTWKPLTASEASALGAQLADASVNDQLDAIKSIQGLGPDMSEAALRQLNLSAPIFAFAGGLAVVAGDEGAAALVLRGHRRLMDNPSQFNVEALGGAAVFDTAYENAMGDAGVGLSSEQQEQIFNAAMAHYVETSAVSGRRFSQRAFTASVQAVTGSTAERVNGRRTLVPPGTNGSAVELFLDSLDEKDLITFSVDTLAPRFVDGIEVTPEEMQEAQLVAIGNGRYRVTIDGQNLITGMDERGFASNYIMRIKPEDVLEAEEALNRPGPERTAEAEAARAAEQARIDARIAGSRAELQETVAIRRDAFERRGEVRARNEELMEEELARRVALERKASGKRSR